MGSPLSSKVALFNAAAEKHVQKQAINPFSTDFKVGSLPKPKISKDEYGRPPKGSLSEARGFKATKMISKEMLELCELINEHGDPMSDDSDDDDPEVLSPKVVIRFRELFNIYTVISNKLVGILLRARKHELVYFEGECLFQRRDDHVPIFLIKSIEEVRNMFHGKTDTDETVPDPNDVEENEDNNN